MPPRAPAPGQSFLFAMYKLSCVSHKGVVIPAAARARLQLGGGLVHPHIVTGLGREPATAAGRAPPPPPGPASFRSSDCHRRIMPSAPPEYISWRRWYTGKCTVVPGWGTTIKPLMLSTISLAPWVALEKRVKELCIPRYQRRVPSEILLGELGLMPFDARASTPPRVGYAIMCHKYIFFIFYFVFFMARPADELPCLAWLELVNACHALPGEPPK